MSRPNPALSAVLTLPESQSRGATVAERLRQAILHGHFAPGEQLREEVLASAMDVSRGPIRDAFSILEREGLIIIRRNRGAFVAQLSREDLEEVFSLRVVLERLAIQLFIRRAGPRYYDELQRIVDTMAARFEQGITEQEAAELDIRFHETIFQGSQHQRLLKCWFSLRHQIHILLLSRNVAHPSFGKNDVTVAGHRTLLALLRAKDEAAALETIEMHIRYAYDLVASIGMLRVQPEERVADHTAADGDDFVQ